MKTLFKILSDNYGRKDELYFVRGLIAQAIKKVEEELSAPQKLKELKATLKETLINIKQANGVNVIEELLKKIGE